MYGKSYRGEVFTKRYRELAIWVLEHQGLFDWNDQDVDDLVGEIDMAIDVWIGVRKGTSDD